MQLHIARLCLDCDEVHTDQYCPTCASERFAFLTRWVPAEERRQRVRQPVQVTEEVPERPSRGRWVKRGAAGAAGIAVVALGRWLWRESQTDRGNGQRRESSQD